MSFEILPQLLANSLISAAIYAVVAVGISVIFALFRFLNFAHGHLVMAGGYIYYALHVEGGLGIGEAVLGTLLLSSVLWGVVYRVFIEKFLELNPLLPFISTLALAIILEAVVSLAFGVNVKSISMPEGMAESVNILGAYITPHQIIILISAILILGTTAFILHSLPIGRSFRALSESPLAALSLGLPGKKFSYGTFFICGAISSIAGILIAYETNLQPTMGNIYTLKAFAAMVLGGLGNIWGTVLGSIALGFIENFSIGIEIGGYSLPSGYKDAFAFLVILLVLSFRPEGIVGKKLRRV